MWRREVHLKIIRLVLHLTDLYGQNVQSLNIMRFLLSSIIQRKISYINAITESNITDVDILIDNISDVIVSAGDMTLLRKSVKAKKKRVRKVDKKWYDRDCHKVYKELKTMKNAFNRNTSNTSIRSQFYKKFKEYKRLTKYKKRKYKERLTSLLNDAMEKDPQAAWKIIDELKNDSVPSAKSERIDLFHIVFAHACIGHVTRYFSIIGET